MVNVVPRPGSLDDVNRAAHALHDRVDGRQTEASAVADLFGREERLEDMRFGGVVHAAARIAEAQLDEVSSGRCRSPHLIVRDVRRFNREDAAARHRVARIDGQVHQHLLQLRGVPLNRTHAGRQARHDLDVFAQRALQELLDLGDDRIEIQWAEPHDLSAAEHQQPPRQRGRRLCGPADFTKQRGSRCVARQFRQRGVRVSADDREQVVEVVRDAAGQPSDRFHFLRLAELLLETLPLGDDRSSRSRPRARR